MPLSPDHDRAQQIELILRQGDNLPTLSTIATRLLDVGTLEDADLDRIVEIIETDPALTARLLGLCRRADKGVGGRVTPKTREGRRGRGMGGPGWRNWTRLAGTVNTIVKDTRAGVLTAAADPRRATYAVGW